MAREIVKVQIPLMTNGVEPTALIYNKDRSIIVQIPISDEILSMFQPGQYKIYVFAELKDTLLHLGDNAPEQNW